MPRPQFTLRALLVAMLIVAAFFGGIRFERERRRRADQVNVPIVPGISVFTPVIIRIDPEVEQVGSIKRHQLSNGQ